jgi:hypothetical protein
MTCGSCGVKIADKAIVCYRCGAPTAIPAAPPSTRQATGGSKAALVMALVLAVLLTVAAIVLPAGSTERHACGVGAGIVAALGVVRWRRGGRSK